MGTFTAGGLKVDVKDGKLVILKEGKKNKKFVKKIPEITFSGSEAVRRGQVVNYITERCVFSLTDKGLELVEVAPGIDVQKQILDLMDFKPVYDPKKVRGDEHVDLPSGADGPQGVHLRLNLENRFSFDTTTRVARLQLGICITSFEDLDQVEHELKRLLSAACSGDTRIAILYERYDDFDCREEVHDDFAKLMLAFGAKYAEKVVRYLLEGKRNRADQTRASPQYHC